MPSLIERAPPGWLATLMRAPVWLFRWRLFPGRRLVMLSHTGRRTGRERAAVLEVVGYEPRPPTWYVGAAWGERSDWFRNLEQNPEATVTCGRRRHPVRARMVDRDEAARIYAAYVAAHPRSARLIGRMVGIDLVAGDPDAIAARIPVVALRSVTSAQPEVARVLTTRAETEATYDRIARWYHLLEGFWERRARAAGLAAMAARPGQRLLELGFGPGHGLVELARQSGEDGLVVGLDLSGNMCRLARRRLQRSAPGAGWGVVQGDATRPPFAPASFDGLFMSFTLELFDTPEIPEVLEACRRLLRPGGTLVVVALDKEGPPSALRAAYEWGHRRLPRLLDCRPIYVSRAVTAAGFALVGEKRVSVWGLAVAVVEARRQT